MQSPSKAGGGLIIYINSVLSLCVLGKDAKLFTTLIFMPYTISLDIDDAARHVFGGGKAITTELIRLRLRCGELIYREMHSRTDVI